MEGYGGEEEFTRLILEEVSDRDVLFDIGACIGLVSVHAARKGADVYAFEPDRNFRSRLEVNLRLNNLNRVRIIEWAVSDMPGNATLYTDGLEGNSPSLRKVGDRGRVIVPTDTIDNALERNEIPCPDVIKMDIEGAEILALRGMARLLSSVSAPRKIFIEIHPSFLNEFKSSPEEVIRLFEASQYKQSYYVRCHDQIHAVFSKDR